MISCIRNLISTTISMIMASFIYNALPNLAHYTSGINQGDKCELIIFLDLIS